MSSISISVIIILYVLLFRFGPSKLLKPNIPQRYLFAIYKAPNEAIQSTLYRYIRHRLPCKLGYVPSDLNSSNTRSLGSIVVSISVSIKAGGQGALCSVFSSFPSNQDCKWGGVSITLPWVTAILGGSFIIPFPFPVSRKTHLRFNRRRRASLHNC